MATSVKMMFSRCAWANAWRRTPYGALQDINTVYLSLTLLCIYSYRVDSSSGDPADALLRRRQDKYYDPLVQWFEQVCGGPAARTQLIVDRFVGGRWPTGDCRRP